MNWLISTYPQRYGSVDVRTFKHQHDANNSSRVRVAFGHGDLGSTAAPTAFPHRNISRTVRTTAATIPPKPNPSSTATSATGTRVQTTRPRTSKLAAVATRTISACVTGDPATTNFAPTKDSGQAKWRTGATRTTRPSATARPDPCATIGFANQGTA